MALTLDVETLRLAHEVGGWDHFRDLGVACCVVYDDERDVYHTFTDEAPGYRPLTELAPLLQDARRRGQPVIGHNVARFDLPLLAHELEARGVDAAFIEGIRVIDTILHLRAATGQWISLDNVVKRTKLGAKTMDGADAPIRWRAGQHEEVIAYCRNDVHLEHALYKHAASGKPVRVWVPGPDRRDYETWDAFEAACVRDVILDFKPAFLRTIPRERETLAR